MANKLLPYEECRDRADWSRAVRVDERFEVVSETGTAIRVRCKETGKETNLPVRGRGDMPKGRRVGLQLLIKWLLLLLPVAVLVAHVGGLL